MAKRSDPKKEKARRNQAYARKFRKRRKNGGYGGYRNKYNSGGQESNSDRDTNEVTSNANDKA